MRINGIALSKTTLRAKAIMAQLDYVNFSHDWMRRDESEVEQLLEEIVQSRSLPGNEIVGAVGKEHKRMTWG